jgi:hypothetical protein
VTWRELPLEKLLLAPWNYKADNPAMMRRLLGSLRRNHQVVNLIVRRIGQDRWEVVNGNHRLRAMRKLRVPAAYCCDLGKITEAAARRVALETNELQFDRDPGAMAQVIGRLLERFAAQDLAITLPFSASMLETYRGAELPRQPAEPELDLDGDGGVGIRLEPMDRELLRRAMDHLGLQDTDRALGAMLDAEGIR